jgi:hypothetical protein
MLFRSKGWNVFLVQVSDESKRRLGWQEYNDGHIFLRMLPRSQTISANISGDTAPK